MYAITERNNTNKRHIFSSQVLLLTVMNTLVCSDSGDSNMSRSSELSISSSMPVILPARFGCRAWISGYRRSPAQESHTVPER